MRGYEITNIGAPSTWRDYLGGFVPQTTRQGRRVVDHEMTNQFIGMTANAYEPGEEAGYWHTHSEIEELNIVLEGSGQMGLDEDIVDVTAGSVVRVGQGVWRTWRALPESNGQLRWICIRAGASELTNYPRDATRDHERDSPW